MISLYHLFNDTNQTAKMYPDNPALGSYALPERPVHLKQSLRQLLFLKVILPYYSFLWPAWKPSFLVWACVHAFSEGSEVGCLKYYLMPVSFKAVVEDVCLALLKLIVAKAEARTEGQ